MISNYKEIWQILEDEIGRCILYKDAAIREMLEDKTYTLQFATFALPEKVATFLEKMGEKVRIHSSDERRFSFTMNGTKIVINCYESNPNLDKAGQSVFGQSLRCDNFGINIFGKYIRNQEAYEDIKARVLHFAFDDFEFNEPLIVRILNFVLLNNFTIGQDITDYIKNNKAFERLEYRQKFCSVITNILRKKRCTWESVANALRLVESFMESQETLIDYTAALSDESMNDRFIRSYLYHLFIALGLSSKDLTNILQNEPTLQYFDSLAINIYACLGEYKTYSEIKANYGDEFIELLMDVQESISRSAGFEYRRVSDATFDIGELFVNDERLWCSEEEFYFEMDAGTEDEMENIDDSIDASKGNAGAWLDNSFNKKNYDDDEEKTYVDDEVEEETEGSGIDTSAFDSYETGSDKSGVSACETPAAKAEPKNANQDIMNSQRGHESTVLNSGGM